MPCPTALSAVPIAAVVLPLPGPVFTMIRPRRISCIVGDSLIVPVWGSRRLSRGVERDDAFVFARHRCARLLGPAAGISLGHVYDLPDAIFSFSGRRGFLSEQLGGNPQSFYFLFDSRYF